MKRGLKHRRVRRSASKPTKPGEPVRHRGHRIPSVVRDQRIVRRLISESFRHCRAWPNLEHFVQQAFFTATLTVVPIVVVFLGSVIDKILTDIRQSRRATIHRRPDVANAVARVIDIARCDRRRRDHLDPRRVRDPTQIPVVSSC